MLTLFPTGTSFPLLMCTFIPHAKGTSKQCPRSCRARPCSNFTAKPTFFLFRHTTPIHTLPLSLSCIKRSHTLRRRTHQHSPRKTESLPWVILHPVNNHPKGRVPCSCLFHKNQPEQCRPCSILCFILCFILTP